MSEKVKKEYTTKDIINFIIMCSIMLGFRFIPATGLITSYGMEVIGILLGLVYGWTFIGLLYPTLIGVILLATTAFGNSTTVLASMFSNETVLMLLVSMFAFASIQHTGAGDWLIAKLLDSKLTKKNPIFVVEVLLVCFLIGGSIGLGMFMLFAILPLVAEMLLKCGYKQGERFNYFVIAGCLMAGQMGLCTFPFMNWGLLITGTATSITKVQISYNSYMLLMLLLSIVFFISYPLLMKICRCDFKKLANANVSELFPAKENKLKVSMKLSLYSTVIFIIVVILASLLSNKIPFLSWINSTMGVVGLMTILWIFNLICKVDGKPLIDMKKASEDFGWGMLVVIALALTLSSALTTAETGISAWLSSVLMPIFNGRSELVFLLCLAVVTTIATNFANNVAAGLIVLNMVGAMHSNGFDVNITAATFIVSITSVFVAFLTPAASMPGALLHTSPAIKPSSCYKWTPILALYGLIILMIIIVPYVLFV